MIKIKKNPNGDTRTAPKNVNFEDFQEANDMHIDNVSDVMKSLYPMDSQIKELTESLRDAIYSIYGVPKEILYKDSTKGE